MKLRIHCLVLAAAYGSVMVLSNPPAYAAEAAQRGDERAASKLEQAPGWHSSRGSDKTSQPVLSQAAQAPAADSQSADHKSKAANSAGLGGETASLEARSKPGGSAFKFDGRNYEQIINTRDEKLIAPASEYYRYHPDTPFRQNDGSINTTFGDGRSLSYDEALSKVKVMRYPWFDELYTQVVTRIPEKTSSAERADHDITATLTATTGWRRQLATENINLKKDYMISHFGHSALGNIDQLFNLGDNQDYLNLDKLWVTSTSIISPMDYDREPYTSEILKKRFYRERPNKANNFSFPSGHTFAGFEYATVMSMIFPERTRELMSNALQFGESRVIVNAHWPTDTIASRTASYFNMAKILGDNELRQSIVKVSRKIRKEVARACGDEIRVCLDKQPEPIAERFGAENDKIGYYGVKLDEKDIAQKSISAQDLPVGAENLLRLRFPYLDDETRRQILADTAYAADTLAGWMIEKGKPDTYWGLIDLPRAARGPVKIDKNLVVNQTQNPDESAADFGQKDTWAGDIAGAGQLVKQGDGELILTGENSFGGFALQGGRLTLTGKNSFSSMSTAQNGRLQLNGSTLDGGLTAYQGAVIAGTGKIDRLILNKGAQLRLQNRPESSDQKGSTGGNKPAQLRIGKELVFNPGSDLRIEVPAEGHGGSLKTDGAIKINGGTVAVVGLKALRSHAEDATVEKMSCRILSAAGGISGKFTGVRMRSLPNMTASLEYRPTEVVLTLTRNDSAHRDAAADVEQSDVRQAQDQSRAAQSDSDPAIQHGGLSGSDDAGSLQANFGSQQDKADVPATQPGQPMSAAPAGQVQNSWQNKAFRELDEQVRREPAADQQRQSRQDDSSAQVADPFTRLFKKLQNTAGQHTEALDSGSLRQLIRFLGQTGDDGALNATVQTDSGR